MSFKPFRLLRRSSLLLMLTCGVAGCAVTRTPPMILNAVSCGAQVPPSYRKHVPTAPIPSDPLTVGKVLSFADGQTAQLSKANGRGDALVKIIDGCDAANTQAVKALTPKKKVLGIF